MKHLLQRKSNFPIEFNDKTEAVTLKKKNALRIELSTLGEDWKIDQTVVLSTFPVHWEPGDCGVSLEVVRQLPSWDKALDLSPAGWNVRPLTLFSCVVAELSCLCFCCWPPMTHPPFLYPPPTHQATGVFSTLSNPKLYTYHFQSTILANTLFIVLAYFSCFSMIQLSSILLMDAMIISAHLNLSCLFVQ